MTTFDMFDSEYGGIKASLWREWFGCCFLQLWQSIQSGNPVHTNGDISSSISANGNSRLFTNSSVTKVQHSDSVFSLINQFSKNHIFLWPWEKGFFIQPLTKSGTSQTVLATAGEATHILLIYWHDALDIPKQNILVYDHPWNCHKPIFTTRTSRNWKKGKHSSNFTKLAKLCPQGLTTFKHTDILKWKRWKYTFFFSCSFIPGLLRTPHFQ